jgi:hypothetical protein
VGCGYDVSLLGKRYVVFVWGMGIGQVHQKVVRCRTAYEQRP